MSDGEPSRDSPSPVGVISVSAPTSTPRATVRNAYAPVRELATTWASGPASITRASTADCTTSRVYSRSGRSLRARPEQVGDPHPVVTGEHGHEVAPLVGVRAGVDAVQQEHERAHRAGRARPSA